MKPKYTFFYKNDSAIDNIVKHAPFSYITPIDVYRTKDRTIYEYEYFDLYCYKIKAQSLMMKAHKTWQVLVEDELYNTFDKEYINCCLMPMMCPYGLLGGRIVRVDTYKEDN